MKRPARPVLEHGLVSGADGVDAASLRGLLDREAIRDVIHRYCHGMDRLDEEVLRSVYWPEATDDHGVFNGLASDFIVRLLDWPLRNERMQHLVGNILIRLYGDTAHSESYFHAFQILRGEDGRLDDIMIGGRYVDEMEKRNGEWRILRRVVAYDWVRQLTGTADWQAGAFGVVLPVGKRFPEDASATLFAMA